MISKNSLINHYSSTIRSRAKAKTNGKHQFALFLITSNLLFVREEAHKTTSGVLVSIHEAAHKPDKTAGNHRGTSDVGLDTFDMH